MLQTAGAYLVLPSFLCPKFVRQCVTEAPNVADDVLNSVKSGVVLGLVESQASIIDLAFRQADDRSAEAGSQHSERTSDSQSVVSTTRGQAVPAAHEGDGQRRRLNPETMTSLRNPATGAEVRAELSDH